MTSSGAKENEEETQKRTDGIFDKETLICFPPPRIIFEKKKKNFSLKIHFPQLNEKN